VLIVTPCNALLASPAAAACKRWSLRSNRDMKAVFDETGMTQRRFVEFGYGARTWKTPRHCVARLEFGEQGNNPRFVVSNIIPTERDAVELYDVLCCQRGEAENRIKEAQLGLFATRTSC